MLAVIVLVLVIAHILVALASTEWFDPNWRYRVKLVLDFTWLDSDVTNLTVPIRLDSSMLDFSKTSPSGDDLVAVSVNGSILPVVVEYWNVSTGFGVLWIRIPYVKARSTYTLYLYFGIVNPSRIPEESRHVWDGYVAVIDMSRYEEVGRKRLVIDVAGRDNNLVLKAGKYNTTMGPVGPSMYFDGKSTWGYIANISFYGKKAFSIEALLYVYDKQVMYGWHKDLMYGSYIATPYTSFFISYSKNASNPDVYFIVSASTEEPGKKRKNYYLDLTWLKGKWAYLVVVYDNSSRTYNVYVNGSLVGNITLSNLDASVVDIESKKWGARYTALYVGANSDGFERTRVLYDFIRVSYKALDPAYIKAEYHVLFNNIVLNVGPLEECPLPPPHNVSLASIVRLVVGVGIIVVGVALYYVYRRYRYSR